MARTATEIFHKDKKIKQRKVTEKEREITFGAFFFQGRNEGLWNSAQPKTSNKNLTVVSNVLDSFKCIGEYL